MVCYQVIGAGWLEATTKTVEGVEFAEAQLVDHLDAEVCAIESKPNMQAYLEIVFRNSITVRVQSGCPLQLLSSVVLLLEDR